MKKKGCLIGMTVFLAFFVVIAIGLWKALTPWSLADKDPRQMVELFICDPAPKSVSDIEADGVIAFAGGEAFISFRIEPSDVESMIKRGGFRPADDRCPYWVRRNLSPNTVKVFQNDTSEVTSLGRKQPFLFRLVVRSAGFLRFTCELARQAVGGGAQPTP